MASPAPGQPFLFLVLAEHFICGAPEYAQITITSTTPTTRNAHAQCLMDLRSFYETARGFGIVCPNSAEFK